MSHAQAVLLLVACNVMWSISGVVTRQLERASGFEVAFWRNVFTVLALLPLLAWLRGRRRVWTALHSGTGTMWGSAACWGIMFTAFMLALTMTTVANVLVTLALTPLLTALTARVALGHRLAAHTLVAILLAATGMAWMYGHELARADGGQVLGIAIAAAVPVCAAINWTLLHHAGRAASAHAPDMLTAILLGAALAALATLPLALPVLASTRDLAWLALLGAVQLAVPCVLAVYVARVLPAPEMALFGLLEILLGVTWVWLFAGERPSGAVLAGGALVLTALVMNEAFGMARARRAAHRVRRARS
ncbi:MAG: DMT family transporter [Gammaproteobacteria bacterium]